MSNTFDPASRLVFVEATLIGPIQSVELVLALDTGATRTQINHRSLRSAGYDLSGVVPRYRVTTASGTESVGSVVVRRFACLGVARTEFPVFCHTVPAVAGIDGLLGLDFLRGRVLTLDFARGRIALGPGKSWWRVWA